MNQSDTSHCPRCQTAASNSSRFCAECGWDLRRPAKAGLTLADTIKLASVAVVVWLVGWITQYLLAGQPPQQIAAHSMPSAQNVRDTSAPSGATSKWQPSAELASALKQAEAKPQDLAGWRAAADLILTELDQTETPANELLFEAIDVLGRIIKIAPKDTDALAAMANIAFNQQALSKAIEYYERYLAIKKDDNEMRANYGMALARLGRFDEGLKQIQQVLSKEPKNFTARGYLAVTYSMKGDKEQALKAGEEALAVSPNAEARARLSDFLASVSAAGANQSGDATTQDANRNSAPATVDSIVSIVRDSPVAGPKYARFEVNSDKDLIIEMNDFPMDKMPPFVRQQFSEKIHAKLIEVDPKEVKSVRMVDSANKSVLVEIARAGSGAASSAMNN